MQLFYDPNIPSEGAFTLDLPETKHLLRVLRRKTGDTVMVTNGKGDLFTCILSNEMLSGCTLSIQQHQKGKEIKPFQLHLGVSMVKNPARFEWFLEKATEIGVAEITPLICHRTEKEQFKHERMHNLLISAMKQSGRTLLPVLNPPAPFSQMLHDRTGWSKYIAWCGDTPRPSLKSVLTPSQNTLILIGPEGDFTEQEVQEALHQNFKAVSLGEATLRTETAALAACFTFNLVNQ